MLRRWASLRYLGLIGCSVIAFGTSANAITVPIDLSLPGFSAALPDPFRLTFDENGNGTIAVNGGTATTLRGTLVTDPSQGPGGGGLVLTYLLPEPVVRGDVLLSEPGTNIISDVLRFTDDTGLLRGVTGAGARMIYYSDLVEPSSPAADLADTGFPTNLGTGASVTRSEVGPEGANGFTYNPGALYPLNNEYVGISDVVPAPLIGHGLLVLLAVGGVLFGGKLLESLKKDHLHAA